MNKDSERKAHGRLGAAHGSAFRAGTGLMGSTECGQRVTQRNVRQLPSGSVVRLDDGGRLIHLHDEVWLYCSDCAHCYDRIENLKWRLPGELCHLPPNDKVSYSLPPESAPTSHKTKTAGES